MRFWLAEISFYPNISRCWPIASPNITNIESIDQDHAIVVQIHYKITCEHPELLTRTGQNVFV